MVVLVSLVVTVKKSNRDLWWLNGYGCWRNYGLLSGMRCSLFDKMSSNFESIQASHSVGMSVGWLKSTRRCPNVWF